MSTLLREGLEPLPYANCLSKTGEFDQGSKEQLAAQLGGLTLPDVIALNNTQQDRLAVYVIPLPRVGGEVAYGVRSGVESPSSAVPFAPRGGFRLRHMDRANIGLSRYAQNYTAALIRDGETSSRRLTGGMDTKSAFIGDMALSSLMGVDLRKFPFINPRGEVMSGGKGEIIYAVHPRDLTPDQKEQSIRAYVRGMFQKGLFTEKKHRFGPDMYVNPEDMEVGRDELRDLGCSTAEANYYITGKPVEAGGIPGRLEATGRGGAVALDEYLKLCDVPTETTISYSLMGYGNVGENFANQLEQVSQYNFSLQAVGDENGVLHDPDGIDPAVLSSLVYYDDESGIRRSRRMDVVRHLYIELYPNRKVEFLNNPRDWLKIKTDVYVPAALGFEVDMDNVRDLTSQTASTKGAPIMFPLSNNGVSSPAQLELEIMGVRTFLYSHINIAGVSGSTDESLFALSPKGVVYPKEYFFDRLDRTMRDLTSEVFAISQELDEPVSMHTAAEALRIKGLLRRERHAAS